LIAQARLYATATSFAALALFPLPTEESWYVKTHRALNKDPEDKDDEPGRDLLNTFCSLMEAAFIALFGTCQQHQDYMRAWRAVSEEGMDEIADANVRTGIEGNFEATRHIRHFVRDEKLALRRRAFLERIATDIWYRDGPGESALVGRQQTTLQAVVDLYFKRSKTINDAVVSAQVDLAICTGADEKVEPPINLRVEHKLEKGRDSSVAYWRNPHAARMRIPKAMCMDLEMGWSSESLTEWSSNSSRSRLQAWSRKVKKVREGS
jgi:hypothetical protein